MPFKPILIQIAYWDTLHYSMPLTVPPAAI